VIDYKDFTADLTKATKLALADLASQRPGETLLVFGYETDDDVVVITPVANTVEGHRRMVEGRFYKEGGQLDSLMIQDWPLYGVGSGHFDQVSETVNRYVHEPLPRESSESDGERKVNLLKSFGRALRDSCGDRTDVFLTIFNPDPTLESLALYYCVACLINPPGAVLRLYQEHVERTLRANGTTLEHALSRLESKGMLISAL
jgi:hypothetical protein